VDGYQLLTGFTPSSMAAVRNSWSCLNIFGFAAEPNDDAPELWFGLLQK
jgi:hypothetical protein